MSNLFAVLFLLSMVAMVMGIINPKKALFFMPKHRQNKRHAILIFGIIFGSIMLVSFIGAGMIADNTNIVEKQEDKDLEKSRDDLIKEKIMEAIGDKDEKKVSVDISSREDTEDEEGKIVLIEINSSESLTRDKILKENKDIFEELTELEEVSQVTISNDYPLVDVYGAVTDELVLKIGMTRETLNKIAWGNFDYENFKKVSYKYLYGIK